MATLTAKYKPYPVYMPSGTEWLGDIPMHWDVRRLKYLATLNDETLPEHTDPNAEITYVDIGNVDSVKGITGMEDFIFEDAPSRARRIVRQGDVIISTVRTYLKAIARIDSMSNCLVVSTGFAAIRPRHLDDGFIAYALSSPYFVESVVAHSEGVSYPAINASELACLDVAFPSVHEQRAIAAFLDRETAKIDALVSKKERLIELLQEKRTALISRAVTKGLNPNAPLKESGVGWLGEIPAHWEVKRLKHLGSLQGGAGFPHEEQWDTTQEYPFFKVGDMGVDANQREMIKYQHTVSLDTASRLGAYVFPPSTIVFAKVGAALMLNRRRMIIRPSCIDNNMMGFIPRVPDPDWMMYWLSGLDLKKLANPGAVPSVNEGQMREQETILPPLTEQRTIAAFLDRETEKIDSLITKVHEAVELLTEKRTALISAAVTGQIDVREEAECT